jgi:hypothetical protein
MVSKKPNSQYAHSCCTTAPCENANPSANSLIGAALVAASFRLPSFRRRTMCKEIRATHVAAMFSKPLRSKHQWCNPRGVAALFLLRAACNTTASAPGMLRAFLVTALFHLPLRAIQTPPFCAISCNNCGYIASLSRHVEWNSVLGELRAAIVLIFPPCATQTPPFRASFVHSSWLCTRPIFIILFSIFVQLAFANFLRVSSSKSLPRCGLVRETRQHTEGRERFAMWLEY